MSNSAHTSVRPLTDEVLSSMADILVHEYEGLFKSAYEHAVQATGARPLEPVDEIRNAFDHFALAARTAFEADRRVVPPPVSIFETSSRRPVNPSEEAFTHIAQARRHLAVGRFYCIEHQLVSVIQRLRLFIDGITDPSQRAIFQARSERLLEKFIKIPVIVAGPLFDREQIELDIHAFNERSEELTKLLVDFLLLANQIVSLQDAKSAIR